MVLDLGLPDIDGLEVIRRVRAAGSAVPIIVLSSRDNEAGKVEALDLGADDYVTKPFGIDELLARVRAALRHMLQQQGEHPVFRSGDLTVDLVRRIVTVRGQEVKFSPREYEVLRLLVQHAGKVLTHKMLLREVWTGDTDVQYLRIYIRALRQKIEPDPDRAGLYPDGNRRRVPAARVGPALMSRTSRVIAVPAATSPRPLSPGATVTWRP